MSGIVLDANALEIDDAEVLDLESGVGIVFSICGDGEFSPNGVADLLVARSESQP